jgi:membrane protein YqaA with SNARE-associated domain
LVPIADLFGVLLTSFALNLIPFAGPSNLLIASTAALVVETDPFTLGFLVALGSVSAKLIHYVVTFYAGRRLNEQHRKRLNDINMKVGKWAFLALFIASATPIPDEPVIVPLGLMKYSPRKILSRYIPRKTLHHHVRRLPRTTRRRRHVNNPNTGSPHTPLDNPNNRHNHHTTKNRHHQNHPQNQRKNNQTKTTNHPAILTPHKKQTV